MRQAELLAAQYDAVVANPPYMGGKGMNALVKKFAKDHFPDAKSDLFACFIERGYTLAKAVGHNAMVTMQSWMFLSSFRKDARANADERRPSGQWPRLGATGFPSEVFRVRCVQTTVVRRLKNQPSSGDYVGTVFFRLH